MTIPITIKVSSEYVQVMTVRKQEFLYNITTVINDVYLITEIDDITIVNNTRNQEASNEFHFKYNKGKSHHVFSSMKREAIVNVSIYSESMLSCTLFLLSSYYRRFAIIREDKRCQNPTACLKETSGLTMSLVDFLIWRY